MLFVRSVLAFLLVFTVVFPIPILAADDPLVMGVFPRRNVKLTHRTFAPLANHLSQKLGREVQLKTAKDFMTFWSDLHKNEFDLVHLNQYHYVIAHDQLGYEAIVMNVEFGENTLAGVLMVRADSDIKTVEDLRGKRVLFGGGPRAMASYIIPTYLLHMAGLNKGDYVEVFAKNPPNAIISTYHKQADAAGIGSIVPRLKMVKQAIDIGKMEYLARGEPLPHLPWAVKKDMPQETRDKIKKIMAELKDSALGQAVLDSVEMTDMQPVSDRDYDQHRNIISEVYSGGGP